MSKFELLGSHRFGSRGLLYTVSAADAGAPFPFSDEQNSSSSLAYESSSHMLSHPVRKLEGGVNSINPSVVVIIIILAVIFFLSGCLHMLIRFIARAPRRDSVISADSGSVLQGQLQQLFHLHDSGVDQAFIDTLPVFLYKSVQGLKEATDCAVCLCTFEAEDALRLLPKCSHAFHTECIDTWLLSHSTCPLCRASLLPECNSRAPHSVFVVIPSDQSEDETRDSQHRDHQHLPNPERSDLEESHSRNSQLPNISTSSSQTEGFVANSPPKSNLDGNNSEVVGQLLPIKLGKFRSTERQGSDNGGATSSGSSSIDPKSSSIDPKRCYSMGSYDYVLDPSHSHVFIAPTVYRKQSSTKTLPLTPGHRPNLSECILPRDIERSVEMATLNEDFVCQSRLVKALHLLKPKKDEGFIKAQKPLEISIKDGTADCEMWDGGSSSSSRTWSSAKSRKLQIPALNGSSEVLGSSRISGRLQMLQSGSGENLGSSRRTAAAAARLQLGENVGSSRRSVSFQPDFAKPRLSSGRMALSEMDSAVDMVEEEEEIEEFHGPHPKTWESVVEFVSSNDSHSSNEGSENSVQSLARRTINWLVGRPKKIVHASASARANNSDAAQRTDEP